MSIPVSDTPPCRRIRPWIAVTAPPLLTSLLLVAATGCETVEITVVEVAEVEVEPATTAVVVGASTRLQAVVRGPEGNLLEGREVEWVSSDDDVATVDGDGIVTGRARGAAEISARAGGMSGSATVEVLPGPVIGLARAGVEFSATEGGFDPPHQEVGIDNDGGGTLTGLSASISWGSGSETGWLDVELDRARAPATLTLRASTGGLAAGAYDADVRVSASDAEGVATLGVVLRVDERPNRPPEAAFRVECTLLFCSFEDRSKDPDGEVESWDWDFGDGSGSTRRNPDHTYALPGSYTVRLRVTDDGGATDAATRKVKVSPAGANSAPEADFEVDCDDDLEFDGGDRSTDDDGKIASRTPGA